MMDVVRDAEVSEIERLIPVYEQDVRHARGRTFFIRIR